MFGLRLHRILHLYLEIYSKHNAGIKEIFKLALLKINIPNLIQKSYLNTTFNFRNNKKYCRDKKPYLTARIDI